MFSYSIKDFRTHLKEDPPVKFRYGLQSRPSTSTNGDKYWQYYVNDKFAEVGSSRYYLHDNDVVEWWFESPNWMN